MPLISSFFGIIIKMYFRDEDKHHKPHFHATCFSMDRNSQRRVSCPMGADADFR